MVCPKGDHHRSEMTVWCNMINRVAFGQRLWTTLCHGGVIVEPMLKSVAPRMASECKAGQWTEFTQTALSLINAQPAAASLLLLRFYSTQQLTDGSILCRPTRPLSSDQPCCYGSKPCWFTVCASFIDHRGVRPDKRADTGYQLCFARLIRFRVPRVRHHRLDTVPVCHRYDSLHSTQPTEPEPILHCTPSAAEG